MYLYSLCIIMHLSILCTMFETHSITFTWLCIPVVGSRMAVEGISATSSARSVKRLASPTPKTPFNQP